MYESVIMNILSINYFNTPNISSNKQAVQSNPNSFFNLRMKRPLTQDCVSFGAKLKDTASIKISNHIEHSATVFLDILESVAKEFEDRGVSFSREYCKLNVLKTSDSCCSKMARSKSTDIRDRIRATLFVKDITNMELLRDLLDALEDRGLAISKTPMAIDELIARGYTPKKTDKEFIDVPDLDIRLDEGKEGIIHLPSKLKYSYSQPQKSGYEDIQMRLYDKHVLAKKSPLKRELIILTGENYAIAKHMEYEHVYKITRKLDELSIFTKPEQNNEQIKLIKRYITLIKQLCSTEISQKLFENAKNKDVYGIKENVSIKLSEKEIDVFKNYFAQIRNNLNEYYENARNLVTDRIDKGKITKELKASLAYVDEVEKELITSIRKINKGKLPETIDELIEIIKKEKESKPKK